MPWLTGDTVPDNDTVEWWCLPVPADRSIVRAVFGSLMELFYPTNWEKSGAAEPEDIAQRMSDFYGKIRRGRPVEVGSVLAYTGGTIPEGWLLCDGQVVSVSAFPLLFDVIGYVFGGGGSSFTLPDLRGRVVVGSGHGSGLTDRALAAAGGEEDHTLTTGEMPNHDHLTHSHIPSMAQLGVGDPVSSPSLVSELSGSAGGGGEHNNMPPFTVLGFIILAFP